MLQFTFPGVIKPFSSASVIILYPILKHNRLDTVKLILEHQSVKEERIK
jgi:hypothetical protein